MQQSVALGVKADITISDFSGAGQQRVAGSETRDNSIEAKPSPALERELAEYEARQSSKRDAARRM